VRNLRLLSLMVLAASAGVSAAQMTGSSIALQIKQLRSIPDTQRPAVTAQIAREIGTLPPGPSKVALADALSHLATEGNPGHPTLQIVAETLDQALQESPVTPQEEAPPAEYMDLARLVRYEGVTVDLKDPLLTMALGVYAANDADASKADFTLRNLHGHPFTLSQLRGRVVLVNFWATWCPPCRKEMADLDFLYRRYASRGLVILSISNESATQVASFVQSINYHPPVLIDFGSNVAKQFHVDGLPHTFVFNRDGKLVAQATDMRTRQQFVRMLADAGLKPL
jgi:peroxiredoxin